MFALDPGTTGPALRAWAQAMPKPKAVLVMSPHWMTRTPVVMRTAQPSTWHDFGGFPPELYALQYPALGSAALAGQVQSLLSQAGIACGADDTRPYDHGAWVPLMHLFPEADVPVVQLSLPANDSLAQLMALGKAIAPLREQGVLVIGSGTMTHNLSELGDRRSNAPVVPYALEFARWIEAAIMQGDTAALLDYRARAPHAQRAHPTDEHFVPLYFALGAADGDAPRYLSREVMAGSFAMDAIAFG